MEPPPTLLTCLSPIDRNDVLSPAMEQSRLKKKLETRTQKPTNPERKLLVLKTPNDMAHTSHKQDDKTKLCPFSLARGKLTSK
jgi:hypothetical protein